MQVRYSVWKDELGIDRSRIFDIDYNIDLGLRILKQYREIAAGNMRRALFLYNNGYKYNNGGYIARVNSSIHSWNKPRICPWPASATNPRDPSLPPCCAFPSDGRKTPGRRPTENRDRSRAKNGCGRP